MSDDEYDDVPYLFSNINWDTIPELASPADAATTSNPSSEDLAIIPPLAEQIGSSSSSEYSCDEDEFNSSFLEELDALEERLTQDPSVDHIQHSPAAASSSSMSGQSRFFACMLPPTDPAGTDDYLRSSAALSATQTPQRLEQPQNPQGEENAKRKRGLSPQSLDSPRKKGKLEDADSQSEVENQVAERMNTYLSAFQDEMTCPICCDYFAAAYMGNPCGHTFCGECGWTWIERCNKHSPSCPVCRTTLASHMPILPNITVDNAVQKHIEALQVNGCEEWKPGGSILKEWLAKKERWKTVGSAKMKKSTAVRQRGQTDAANTGSRLRPLELDDDDHDVDYLPDLDLAIETILAQGLAETTRPLRRNRRRNI